jgi:hypothetical protein
VLDPVLAALIALALAPAAAQDAPPPLAPDPTARAPLLAYDALRPAMRRLGTEHPGLVEYIPIGTSRGGRDIEALRIAAGELRPGRPAVLLVANIDGPRVYTSGIALDHAARLATGYASDPAIKAFLDTTTVYVIPRANPDAAEARFETPLREREASGRDADDDRDGRTAEDPGRDVDGDGRIAQLRTADPDGTWVEDPADARALVVADPKKGQAGRYELWLEGDDLDGDERVAEDEPWNAVVNRNFPAQWREHDPAAGQFPTDEPEARALADFVIAHPEIALVLVYGALDNLVETPKTVDEERQKQIPKPGLLEEDGGYLAELGKRYRERTASKARGSGDPAGTFQAWAYAHRGLWTLEAALWSIPLDEKPRAAEGAEDAGEKADAKDAPKPPEPSDDAKRLRWIDAQAESGRFLGWKPYAHPVLGPVEIGGFAPYARIEPPDAERARIADAHLAFLTSLGAVLARVELAEVRARDLGGLLEIEATLVNRGLLPLASAAGARARTVRPVKVSLRLPEGATLVAGRSRVLVDALAGSGGRRELRWLVSGAQAGAVAVVYESDHAGAGQATPELAR